MTRYTEPRTRHLPPVDGENKTRHEPMWEKNGHIDTLEWVTLCILALIAGAGAGYLYGMGMM